MNLPSDDGIRLDFDSGREPVTHLDAINATLHPIGFRGQPVDVGAASAAVRAAVAGPTLDDAQQAAVLEHFALSRQQLVEFIEAAGRTPQVAGGGALQTYDATNDVHYPQVFVVEPGADFSRFDRFHVNDTPDAGGLDEVLQLVSGGGVRVLQHLPGEGVFTVTLDCVDDQHGWLITYDGGRPHIGTLTQARPGTKLVVQAIGPPTWGSHYVSDDEVATS